ncbi:hypothetical protein P8452_04591 [Trifolium repens]|nr:hypothetical protein QL285_005091 [Trifolium repens]WJX14307.1 hypothetical protein P8452_04591 [Trifolium repens]
MSNGCYGHIPCKLESRLHQERSAQSLTDYDPFSLRDLLRMVRNVFQHHDDNYKDLVASSMEDPLVGNSMGSTYDYLLGGFDNLLAVAYQLVVSSHFFPDEFR